RLVPDRADERGQEPVLERLLEQDQEHEQPDRGDEQREPDLGASHLLQREEHRRPVWPGRPSSAARGARRRSPSVTVRGVWETRAMDQVALSPQDAHDRRDGIELVHYAESKGFDAVWQADSRLVRDAVV